MSIKRTCPKCDAELLDGAIGGLCPKCVAAVTFESVVAAEVPSANSGSIAQPRSPIENPKIRYFGDYELVEEIARGGMGVVYKARQVTLNRTVALKMILEGRLAGADAVQRFRTEAESAANLHHANIIPIYDIGEQNGQHYFTMAYVEGRTLTDLARDKPLPGRAAAAYLKIIAEATQYAHQRGIIHRDLKPSNVIIDHNDQPKITDFGLAKRLDGSASDITVTGQVLGSPNFMPPEQAGGKKRDVGPHSDVYALGGILYYLITARNRVFSSSPKDSTDRGSLICRKSLYSFIGNQISSKAVAKMHICTYPQARLLVFQYTN